MVGGPMAKKRVTRKQLLKEPDEFMTFTGKLIQFGRKYDKQLTYAACAFFIIIIGLTAFRFFSNRAENTASDLLRQAMKPGLDSRSAGTGAGRRAPLRPPPGGPGPRAAQRARRPRARRARR